MKTKIITVESHDDLISVRDRMSWAKTPRILLVIPKFEKNPLRRADFKVLQRHASALGAQVGVVTRVRGVRADAEALGIPVFESTGEAQKATWALRRQKKLTRRPPAQNLRTRRGQVEVREEAWRARPVTRLSAFSVGVLSVFAIVALFIPRARVQIQPIVQTQTIVLPVIASESTDAVFVTGDIPAHEKRILLDGMQTALVTGEGVTPQSKARGFVEFRNLTQAAVTIPAGTIVETARDTLTLFVTLKEGVVAAGVGKTIEIEVEAVEGGVAGNLPEDSLIVIDGRLGLSLSVTNPEPTSGGRERASVQASDADRTRVKKLLLESLDEQARAEFLNSLDADDVLFEDSIAVSQIILEEFNPPAGASGAKLTLTMQVEYFALYASASDLRQLASLALNASLPSGFRAASDSMTIESAGSPTLGEDNSARWQIRAEREIVQSIDPAPVTALIRGLDVEEAQSLLDKSFEWEDKPVVTMFPSWWKWIPLVPFRIEVVTK